MTNLLPETVNHAPVTVALFASALVSVILALLKAKYNIDLSGQESNLQTLAIGAGYFVGQKVGV
jgi:hypothetical protein